MAQFFNRRVLLPTFVLYLSKLVCASPQNNEKSNFIIIISDDQGWADFSPNKINSGLKTPYIDKLVQSGALITNGYASAPQCIPARVGLLLGKSQNRIGIERNSDPLERFEEEKNLAELLSEKKYKTAMIGKWHLGDPSKIPDNGFHYFYNQTSFAPFLANFTYDGELPQIHKVQPLLYHIEACSKTAVKFIQEHNQKPFFIYLSYRSPHVPLDPPQKYLDRFPHNLPRPRKRALAMLTSVDDGIGEICNTLERFNLTENTCIFYISDNGAPLKLEAKDATDPALGWNGSYNAPLNGEKGMLTEGGIRIPFAIHWPKEVPAGLRFEHPVSILDITPTIISHLGINQNDLDGVDLLPFLKYQNPAPPHKFICWRWIAQTAIREGDWKYLQCEDRKYLFNLKDDLSEKNNLISKFTKKAENLSAKLSRWCQSLEPPGIKNGDLPPIWVDYFDYHLKE